MSKKKNDELLRKTFHEGFKAQYERGLKEGAHAICQVVYDKSKNTSLSVEDRLKDIVKTVATLASLRVIDVVESANPPKESDEVGDQ